jgi:hypothetical protein
MLLTFKLERHHAHAFGVHEVQIYMHEASSLARLARS